MFRTALRQLPGHLPAFATLGCVLAVVAACSSAAPAPAAPAAAAPATAAATTTVTMTEYKFALDPGTLTAGQHTFHAVNAGTLPHAIELDGAGLSDQKSAIVQPGSSADLTVTLQAGDLDIYCPVGNHRAKGMETHATVAAASADGASGGY